ncbi:MAG: competence/damage-inducible protein A [Candidatus Zixiibacteriota bacterium]
MTIDLITIGSELLSGVTLNTNAAFIGDQLARAGLRLARQISIPDDLETIVATVRESLAHAEWVIVSGGLGPTHDDVTKNAISRVFDRPLVLRDEILVELRERLARVGRPLTPLIEAQALLPRDVETLPNPVGTAVGILLTTGTSTLVAVPGVPREMRPMVADYIVPRIAAQAKSTAASFVWSTTGWPESRLYETLEAAIKKHADLEVAFLPSELGVRLRVTAVGLDASLRLASFADEIRPLIGPAIYAEEDIGLEDVLARLLRERGLTLALAESCTGGLAAKRMTDIPGSSAYMLAAFVTYANRAKIDLLGVDAGLIDAHGAVSEPVARAMAEGARARTGAACALSITGIAGPDGGTAEKPVGLVWIALSMRGATTTAEEFRFLGNREMIRARAAQAALNMLRLRLIV